jgi:two-component system, OmpR family, alkaline phosphatase synthesis response regulator PhoP
MKTVLVIDDEEHMRKEFSSLVSKMGYNVITAENGTAGIELVKAQKPDCVFLDIMLPDMNGGEVYRQIKEIDKGMRIFLVSGDEHEIHKLHILDFASADGYLVKPFFPQDIKKLLDSLK